MIIISLTDRFKIIRNCLNNNAKWCYIGKDIAKREKIAQVLGSEKRFYLKDRLHKVAEELRQPYLDFVAEIGKEQKNQLNWWASRFASKAPFQTDFFLLFCYKVLIIELIREKIDNDILTIFIEDPWLFADIKNTSFNKSIKFLGYPNIFFHKFFFIGKGIIFRLFLIIWFILARSLVYYYHRGEKPKILRAEKIAVGILNPAERRSFKNGQYGDEYMLGLSNLYEKNKIPFFYLYLYLYLFPLSIAKYVGINKETLWPLINDAKFLDLIRRFFERWDPILNNDLNKIREYNVSILLQRERWFEFSSVGFNINLILFDTFNNFFSKRWCHSLIYLFENQPWEKMLCMSALKNNVRLIGYQHSCLWKLFLSQFTGKGENLFMPLPQKIFTVGHYCAELYKEGGIPEEKIVVGGAWRYFHLLEDIKNDTFAKRNPNSKPVILISLSIDVFISKTILKNIFDLISKNYLNNCMEFLIKPHPLFQRFKSDIENSLPPGYRNCVVNKPFKELLKEVDVVISSGTTAGLESFLYGKKVISFVPENLLAADPLLDITDKRIYKWYEGEEFDVNFLKSFSPILNLNDIKEIKNKYFGHINDEIWIKFVKTTSCEYY